MKTAKIEVTVTATGETLKHAQWCAKQLCMTVEEYLGTHAHDIQSWIADSRANDPSGMLLDVHKDFVYPDEAIRQRAADNLKALRRKIRIAWVRERLPELDAVWPKEDASTDYVLYRCKTGDFYVYSREQEDLILCGQTAAMEFVCEGKIPEKLLC